VGALSDPSRRVSLALIDTCDPRAALVRLRLAANSLLATIARTGVHYNIADLSFLIMSTANVELQSSAAVVDNGAAARCRAVLVALSESRVSETST